MKKLAIMSLALMATCGSVFAASADFPINSKTWETLSQNLKVIEFSAQTKLPINFFLKGDLVNLVENEGNFGAVEVMQTFYARCVQQELILSTNLTDWKPFLEFITGNVSVSLSIQDGKPSIVVGAETNQRS